MSPDRAFDAFISDLTRDAAQEYAEAKRVGGDVMFYSRLARFRTGTYIEACSTLSIVTASGASSEVKDKAKSDVRKAKEYLKGAAKLLDESVNSTEKK